MNKSCLIDQSKNKYGLDPLQVDLALSKIMASNKYFRHKSSTYGSSFDMMKKYGFAYRVADKHIL